MTSRIRGFLIAAGVLALAGATPALLRNSRAARSYEGAPACRQGENISTACRQERAATVERLYTQGAGRTQRLLMLARLADGEVLKTQVPSAAFWQNMEQGSPITVEIWSGQIMRIRALGRDEPTSDNPAWRVGNARAGLIAVSCMLALMAVMIVLALRFGRRRTQAAQ